jgi:hypothetical protein
VGEIKIPGVRGDVGTLREVTNVAEVALVDYFPVVFSIDPIDLTSAALIDQVK